MCQQIMYPANLQMTHLLGRMTIFLNTNSRVDLKDPTTSLIELVQRILEICPPNHLPYQRHMQSLVPQDVYLA